MKRINFYRNYDAALEGEINREFGFIHLVDESTGHCREFLKVMFRASAFR